MRTRLGREVSRQFPELQGIVDAVGDAVFDGELVVLTGEVPDWGAVIGRLRARSATIARLSTSTPVTMMVFDVLALDGEDLRRRPYRERRGVLEGLSLADRWVVPPASDDGPTAVEVSARFGLEGVIAKRAASPYVSGRRSRYWVKVRHKDAVDVLVVGWVLRESGGLSLLLAEATKAVCPM